jgi:hypothetical protein
MEAAWTYLALRTTAWGRKLQQLQLAAAASHVAVLVTTNLSMSVEVVGSEVCCESVTRYGEAFREAQHCWGAGGL